MIPQGIQEHPHSGKSTARRPEIQLSSGFSGAKAHLQSVCIFRSGMNFSLFPPGFPPFL
jgi:hypothetical protein